jgi:hypothetical protein
MLVRNPETGALVNVQDPSSYLAQGYTEPTDAELEHAQREMTYGTTGQQVQAQAERVGRGLTLGQFEGVGTPEEIRARDEVSRELSPVTSFAADVAPALAVGAATGGLAGAALGVEAGVGASTAARLGVLAAGELGGGAVQAAQTAYGEGRQFLHDDIAKDVEQTAIWTGLGVALGGVPIARQALKGGKAGAKAAVMTAEEVAETAAAAEGRAVQEAAPAAAAAPAAEGSPLAEAAGVAIPAPDATTGQPGAPAAPAAPISLEGKTLEDLKALPIEGEGDLGRVEALKQDKGFAATGRVTSNDGQAGITLVNDGGDLVLRDGRHRLQAAQELGRDSVYGRYVDGESGKVLFEGDIPLKAPTTPEAPRIPGKAAAAEEVTKEAADNGMSRAVRNASKADAEDIVERATRGAAGDATGKAPKSFARAGKDVEQEAAASEEHSLFRDRRLYQNREAILDTATREMQGDLGKIVKDVRELTERQVPDAAGKVGENITAQRGAARTMAENAAKWSGQLRAEAREFAQFAGKKGLLYAAPEQKAWTLALLEHAQAIGEAKTGKEVFEAANALKQATRSLRDKLGALAEKSPAQQKLLGKLDDFSGSLRSGLEDKGTWGQAGEMLAVHHQTATDQLLPSLDAFEKEGWGKRVKDLLAEPDPAAREQLGKMLDAMTANAESQLKFGGDKLKAEAVIAKADKIRRTMGLADEVADATGRMQTIGKVAGSVPLVGSAVKGAITGDLGTAYRRLTQSTDAAVGKGVDDWIRSSKVRGGSKLPALLRKLPALSPEQKALLDIARRRGVTVGMAKFMGDDDSPMKALERRRDALLDEESFFERVSGDFNGLQQQSPEAFMLLSGKVAEARQFLIERMPTNVAVSMARPGGYPPSKEAVEDWSVYWNAVEHPIDAVKNLAGLRIQEAETIQKLYPRLWEQTQQTVLEKIGNAQSGGDPLDDTMLIRLDLMFQLDGAGSPAFSQRAAKTGSASPAPAPATGASSRAPTDAKRMVAATPSLTGATMGTMG